MSTLVAPTLERLIRDARVLLGQPKAENSRWSDSELSSYANDAIQQIFLFINEIGEGQFDKSANLDIASGVETVDLPSDCFAIKALYKVQGTVNRRLEYRQSVLSDYDNNSNSSGSSAYEPYYYLRGNKIVLRPTPGFTEANSLVIEYTAYPSVLLYSADSLDNGISPLFKEMVVMYIVSKAKLKDDLVSGGNSRNAAETHLGNLYVNFKHQLSERSKAPQYVSPFEPI